MLNNSGIKISKIADISVEELNEKVKEITIENKENSLAVNDFKIAMLNFDQTLFYNTYNGLLEEKTFRQIYDMWTKNC